MNPHYEKAYSGKRDTDLSLALDVSRCFGPDTRDSFILAGSYAIEALTSYPLTQHNDVDANIFTTDSTRSIWEARRRLDSLDTNLVSMTESRLDLERDGSLIELQFVQYDTADRVPNGVTFRVPKNGTDVAEVPTTIVTIFSSNHDTYAFRVKTLPYAIGTWALRIAGCAENQKREVRLSDIIHFDCLTRSPYDVNQVVEAMTRHPQMPAQEMGRELEVLHKALAVASKLGNNNA